MEEFEELSPSLLPLLRAPSAQLRVQAAATLAALAVAAHPRAARLLRVCMGELKQALQALGGGSGGGTPRGVVGVLVSARGCVCFVGHSIMAPLRHMCASITVMHSCIRVCQHYRDA